MGALFAACQDLKPQHKAWQKNKLHNYNYIMGSTHQAQTLEERKGGTDQYWSWEVTQARGGGPTAFESMRKSRVLVCLRQMLHM